jgi:hypothetical protein
MFETFFGPINNQQLIRRLYLRRMQKYVGLPVKYASLVSDFNPNWNVPQNLVKSSTQNFMEICSAAIGSLQKDRYTRRHDEASTIQIFATFCCERNKRNTNMGTLLGDTAVFDRMVKEVQWTAETQ